MKLKKLISLALVVSFAMPLSAIATGYNDGGVQTSPINPPSGLGPIGPVVLDEPTANCDCYDDTTQKSCCPTAPKKLKPDSQSQSGQCSPPAECIGTSVVGVGP